MKDESNFIDNLKDENSRDKAFEILLDKYKKPIYWHIRKIVLDHDDSHDVLQNTLVKVFRGIKNFKENSKLYTWIYRIAINLAKNFVKKPSTRFEKISISIDEHQYDLPEDLDPLSFISNEQLKSNLDSFISSMPEKLKTAFVLREYDGKSYEEIAAVTNCPVGTVRSRIFRAREEIINYFKEETYERD